MQNDTSVSFPNILRAMSSAGLNKKELAFRLGVSMSTLYRRLNGVTQFRWNELQSLHTLFPDIPVSLLIERT